MFRKTEFDLCIIGGGAAGLVTAAGGAGLGAKVVLIEKNKLGGDCLYTGCVPSKALLHQAAIAHTASKANKIGLNISGHADFSLTHEYVQSVIKSIEPNDSPERFRDMGVEVIFGEAEFLDKNTVRVSNSTIRAKNFVLATGSRPAIPGLPGLGDVPYFTNETIFENKKLLPELVIIGSGPIGLEMAQAHQRLGSKVIVVDFSPSVLPREDRDLSELVQKSLEADGVTFHLSKKVEKISSNTNDHSPNITLHLANADENSNEKITLKASHLLIATGRLPNIENLGLNNAGITVESGKLVLNNKLCTSNKHVYACGDLAGPYYFTHMAEHQAGIVLRNTLFHMFAKPETNIVPWCTFTDPELAKVGLTETEAKNINIQHEVIKFPFAEIDRALTDDHKSGFIKVIVGKKDKILGAAIVGKNAGELIHEYVLAMKQNLKLGQLSSLIHIYPTLSLINRRAADTHLKSKLTPFGKKLIKFLFRLRGN